MFLSRAKKLMAQVLSCIVGIALLALFACAFISAVILALGFIAIVVLWIAGHALLNRRKPTSRGYQTIDADYEIIPPERPAEPRYGGPCIHAPFMLLGAQPSPRREGHGPIIEGSAVRVNEDATPEAPLDDDTTVVPFKRPDAK